MVEARQGTTVFDLGPNPARQAAGKTGAPPRREQTAVFVDDFAPDDLYVGLRTVDLADSDGFGNLRLTNRPGGMLVTCGAAPGNVTLTYRFQAKKGRLSKVAATLTGTADPECGGVNQLALSTNGKDWPVTAEGTQKLELAGPAEFAGVRELFVRVQLRYRQSPVQTPANAIERLDVRMECQ